MVVEDDDTQVGDTPSAPPLWEDYVYDQHPDLDVRTWQHPPPPQFPANTGARNLVARRMMFRTPASIFMKFLPPQLLDPVVKASNSWHTNALAFEL